MRFLCARGLAPALGFIFFSSSPDQPLLPAAPGLVVSVTRGQGRFIESRPYLLLTVSLCLDLDLRA